MTVLAITKKDALASTAEIKREVGTAKKARIRILRMIARSIDADEYKIAGFTELRAWLQHVGIDTSVSHFLRQLHNVRLLKHVTDAQLEAMPEGNAYALAHLENEKLRRSPKMIEMAVSEKPAEFKQTIAKVQGHEPAERWATYARRAPKAVVDAMLAAEEKIARVLELDIAEDSPKRATNLITVMEGLAQLVNGTDERILHLEIEGLEQ